MLVRISTLLLLYGSASARLTAIAVVVVDAELVFGHVGYNVLVGEDKVSQVCDELVDLIFKGDQCFNSLAILLDNLFLLSEDID